MELRSLTKRRGGPILIAPPRKDCQDDALAISGKAGLDTKLPPPVRHSDGRLYSDGPFGPEFALYCEGLNRPYFRGVLHFLCAGYLATFGMYHFHLEAADSAAGRIAGIAYILTNLICYGVSGAYHVYGGCFPKRVEILLQKLDHVGISLLSTGTTIPTAVLVVESPLVRVIFLAFSFSVWAWLSVQIFRLRPSVLRQVLSAGNFLPFLPFFFFRLNALEAVCFCSCAGLHAVGVAVFTHQIPKQGRFYQRYAGYHELFHLLVVSAGACVYLMNWSILRRWCNTTQPVDIIAHPW